MTALEVRIIAYGLAVLGLIGFGGWSGYRLTRNHYEAAIAADRAAQDNVLAQAQAATIAAQNAQAAATRASEQQYENLKASYDGLGARLADSVRELTAIHRSLVSSGPRAPAEPHAASAGAGGDTGIAAAAGRATDACLHDAAELTALQSWAQAVGKTP